MWDEFKTYFADFDGTTSACRTIVLWITLCVIVLYCSMRLYLCIAGQKNGVDGNSRAMAIKMFNGGWIVGGIVLAVCFITTFFACYLADVANDRNALVPILFYPLLTLCAAIVSSAATVFFKPDKAVKRVCAAVCACTLIAAIVCMCIYYADSGDDSVHNIGLYISAVIMVVATIGAAVFADKKSRPFDTRALSFAAVCIALSFALSYVRIFKMPMGGSITLASMLPLMLFAFMFGCRRGVIAGAVYGILQAVQDPWIIHPAQFALDYLAAFAAIGLAGCVRDLGLFKGKIRAQFALGAAIACIVRFVCHYFAGVFAFGVYAEGFAVEYGMPTLANEYFYSFVYQCLYLVPELVIVMAGAMLVLSSKAFVAQIELYAAKGLHSDGKTPIPEQPD